MRPSDVPFIEVISGRMLEVYNAVKVNILSSIVFCLLLLRLSLLLQNLKFSLDPRIRFLFSIPGTFTMFLSIAHKNNTCLCANLLFVLELPFFHIHGNKRTQIRRWLNRLVIEWCVASTISLSFDNVC